MADYTRISPATLTSWSDVIADPTTNEQANLLWQAILQTRQFVFDFLDDKFDKDAGDILKAATLAATSLAGAVRGSTSNAGSQQELVQGTVSTPDLRDAAVAANKIASDAVTTVKVLDANITTAKIADSAITTAKILDANVTTGKLASKAVTATELKDDATGSAGAVTTDHVRSVAITTAKIADAAITRAKLLTGTLAQVLVCQSDLMFTPKTMSGDATIAADGTLTLATKGFAFAMENPGSGTNGGASVVTAWNLRGDAVAWSEIYDTLNLMVIGTGADKGKIYMAAGTYLIRVSAPAYKTDAHLLRIRRFNASAVLQQTGYGTSESSPAADTVPTRAFLTAQATFTAGDYVQIEHYTTAAEAADGLGKAASIATIPETFAMVEFLKIG